MACAETDKVEVEWVQIQRAGGNAWKSRPGPAVEMFTALLSLQLESVKKGRRGVFPIHSHPSPPPTLPASCHREDVRILYSRDTLRVTMICKITSLPLSGSSISILAHNYGAKLNVTSSIRSRRVLVRCSYKMTVLRCFLWFSRK
jgi:hypothetical protein